MKVLNIIWKFGTGGIAKCFLSYAALSNVDEKIRVISVCINPINCECDKTPLVKIGAEIIDIENEWDLSWMGRVYQLIKVIGPDVIFCHGFNGPIIVSMLKVRYHIKIPMVCSFHGIYYAPISKKKWLEPIYNSVMFFLYKYFAKGIIVVSEYSKKELLKHHIQSDKLFVIHNGIDNVPIDFLGRTGKDGTIRIGVVSRLDPFKGIDVLISALVELKKQTEVSFMLDIVGDGPMEQTLKEMVRNNEMEYNVAFVGYQSDILNWMNYWDIFCLPSFFENHSISLLEAMRSGKAIITTKVGGNEESVTDGKEALVVPAKNVEALTKALKLFCEDRQLRNKLGQNARDRFLREFTLETMQRNLINVLSTVVGKMRN